MSYYLGVDFGTEGVRAALFDAEGSLCAMESEGYPTYYPKAGWVEQKPEEWWKAFIKVMRRLVEAMDVPPEEIAGMACDTTSCTVLLLDSGLSPIRNALIWMDVRASSQAHRIAGSGSSALKYNGYGSVSAEWMPSKLLWLKENEPELYGKATYACAFQDWVNYRLTGEWAGSINNVTVRWYYDSSSGGWPTGFYERIGLSDAISKFPARILRLGETVGRLIPSVSRQTGLPEGLAVVQGGADAYIGMLGLGAVRPGRVAFITGSSHLLLGHTMSGFHRKGIFGAFPDSVVPGMWVVEGGQISTGSILKWFKEQFIGCTIVKEAERQGLGLYDYMNRCAERIRPGSEGLVLLDYWQGNRNPVTDSRARGAVWGLSLRHTPAHIYRAIMEGVAYGTEHIMRVFREAGYQPEELVACGGATKSSLWMQIHSDVLGMPIHLTVEQNAPLLGDAILAACGTGCYSGIEEAVKGMVKKGSCFEPDKENTERYRYYVDRYIDTYTQLKELMWETVGHEEGSE
jgi:FGGY-family pentulose kinase